MNRLVLNYYAHWMAIGNVIIKRGPDSAVDHYTLLEPTMSHLSQETAFSPLQP